MEEEELFAVTYREAIINALCWLITMHLMLYMLIGLTYLIQRELTWHFYIAVGMIGGLFNNRLEDYANK